MRAETGQRLNDGGGTSASGSVVQGPRTTPSAGELHACNDPSVPTTARWKFYRYIFGGGGTSYPEKKGLICYIATSYYAYAGGGMKHYICDDGMVNCRRSDKKEYIYTKIVSRDTGTEYQYADQVAMPFDYQVVVQLDSQQQWPVVRSRLKQMKPCRLESISADRI